MTLLSSVALFFLSIRSEGVILPRHGGIRTEGEKAEFRSRYFILGYARNFPAAHARQRFRTSIPHPYLGYRYFISNDWLAGIGAQFRFLEETQSGGSLVLATISQESSYIIRVYYPLFATIGGRLLWLNPVRKGMFPLQRHPDYTLELGVAGGGGLLYHMGDEYFFELRLERWRGTRTMKLHGSEISLNIAFSF